MSGPAGRRAGELHPARAEWHSGVRTQRTDTQVSNICLDKEHLKNCTYSVQKFHLDYMENKKERSGKIHTMSKKHRKKWKTLEREMKNLSELYNGIGKLDRENYRLFKNAPDNDISFKTDGHMKINKVLNHDDTQNCLHHKKHKRKDPCTSPSIHMSSVHVKAKKAKKNKKLSSSPVVDLGDDSSRQEQLRPDGRSPKSVHKKKSHHRQKGLQAYLYSDRSQCSDFNGSRDVSQFHRTWKSEVLDSTLRKSGKEILAKCKRHKKFYNDTPVCASPNVTSCEINNCSRSIGPFLSSTPAELEIKILDLKEKLHLEMIKEIRTSPIADLKNEEMCSNSDPSQDLFITQKSFLPVQLSSAGSSPSLQQHTMDADIKGCKPTNSVEKLQLLSQLPSVSEKGDHPHLISQCKGPSTVTNDMLNLDKATQTEDCYTSPGLASSISYTKRGFDCPEQPLDLSLPFRIRSRNKNTKRVSFSVASVAAEIPLTQKHVTEAVCTTEDQASTTKGSCIVPDDAKRNTIFNQLRKMDEGKYIQTLLNSSYFFKGKGEPDVKTPISPLVKKAKTEKRVEVKHRKEKLRSSIGLRCSI